MIKGVCLKDVFQEKAGTLRLAVSENHPEAETAGRRSPPTPQYIEKATLRTCERIDVFLAKHNF